MPNLGFNYVLICLMQLFKLQNSIAGVEEPMSQRPQFPSNREVAVVLLFSYVPINLVFFTFRVVLASSTN